MNQQLSIIHAYELDQSHEVDWARAKSWTPERGDLWLHLDRTSEQSQSWLHEESGIEGHVVNGLLASSTRPRLEVTPVGMLFTLRGVNLNEHAEPSDMISLRIWVEPHRLISLEREHLRSVAAIAELIKAHKGPKTTGALLGALLNGLTSRVGPIVDGINEQLDHLEDLILSPEFYDDRNELIMLRQQAIMLHRHIHPQAEVLVELSKLDHELFDEEQVRSLRNVINQNRRFIEDLEAAKNRMQVLQDELTNQLSERINHRMYAATMIAAILLPMTIFTGLLGINVGGIPGSNSPSGFLAVCVILAVMGVVGFWIIRWCKWL